VKQIFKQIYNTNDLISSFDGCNIFRPYLNEIIYKDNDDFKDIKTHNGWFHVDQGKSLSIFLSVIPYY
jgi:hypothetical protein